MSDISRRAFIRAGVGLAIVASPLALAGQAIAAPGRLQATTFRLERSTFLPHVGSAFEVTDGGSSFTAVLTEVRDVVGGAPADEHRFALLFTAPRSTAAGDGTYRFGRPGLGRFELHVTAIDRGVKSHHYEAVVNRLH